MAVVTANYIAIHTTTWRDRVLNSTAEEIATSAVTAYAVELDNSANTVVSYAKFYDKATAPSVGGSTENPAVILRVPAATKMLVVLNQGAGVSGTVFALGCWIAGLTTKGTAGSTSPASDFLATLYTNTPA